MNKEKNDLIITDENRIDEIALFNNISLIIENRIYRAQRQANAENILMFWEIGNYIGTALLGGERAGYGKQIVVPLAQQLSWFHFIALLPFKSNDAWVT